MRPVTKEDLAMLVQDFLSINASLYDEFKDFVEGKLVSSDWGTWAENVASWVSTRQSRDNFLLLRYEDMLENTRRELARVASLLGLASSDEAFERAISASSADHMRALEKQEQDLWIATKKHRKDIPFVGAAAAGSWSNNLPEPCIKQIESAWCS